MRKERTEHLYMSNKPIAVFACNYQMMFVSSMPQHAMFQKRLPLFHSERIEGLTRNANQERQHNQQSNILLAPSFQNVPPSVSSFVSNENENTRKKNKPLWSADKQPRNVFALERMCPGNGRTKHGLP